MAAACLSLAGCGSSTAGADATAGTQGGADIPAWQAYVETPASLTIRPKAVVSTSGDVSNAAALLGDGSGRPATLNYPIGGTAPEIVLDFGREVGGFTQLDVVSSSLPNAVVLAYSEALAYLSPSGDAAVTPVVLLTGSPLRFDLLPVLLPGKVRTAEIQGGQRYVSVRLAAPGSLTLGGVETLFTAAQELPQDYSGYFRCSDDFLNRIWYASAYTLNLVQVQPGTPGIATAMSTLHLLVDGAKRDRGLWAADLMVSGLADYYASDPVYLHDSLLQIGNHPATVTAPLAPAFGDAALPGPMPGLCSFDQGGDGCFYFSDTYSMSFVTNLYDYYRYTGDLEFVRQEWPLVQRELAYNAGQVDSATGLYEIRTVASGGDWNTEYLSGELTFVNDVYYAALSAAAVMGAAVGDANAVGYARSARQLKDAINRQLWDSRRDLYGTSTSDRTSVAEDANVFAVVTGVASDRDQRALLTNLDAALASKYGTLSVSSPVPGGYTQLISPYLESEHLFALLANDMSTPALGLMRTLWGHMVNGDPGGTVWEKLQPDGQTGSGQVSTAHGWSTGPIPALSGYVLGLTPASPGFASWSVAPHPGDLAWAEGAVGTPHGILAASWRVDAGATGGFSLYLEAPAGTGGSASLPVASSMRVTVDAELVWDGRAESLRYPASYDAVHGRLTIANLSAGTHALCASSGSAPCEQQPLSGL